MIGAWAHQPLSEASVQILREEISRRTESINMTENQGAVFYPVGSELITECKSGFKMIGDNINVCEDEDSWRSTFARCEEVVCSSLQNIHNGRVTVEGFSFGQSVYYECDLGYRQATSNIEFTGGQGGTLIYS